MNADSSPDPELTERERAHLRHRDQKRVTPMVVDNAGLRRTVSALAHRREREAQARRAAVKAEPPPAS